MAFLCMTSFNKFQLFVLHESVRVGQYLQYEVFLMFQKLYKLFRYLYNAEILVSQHTWSRKTTHKQLYIQWRHERKKRNILYLSTDMELSKYYSISLD